MLKQKPEIGDTLVLRNGERFTCCAVEDLREVQQHWAQKYLDEYGGYLGMHGSDKWMHWTQVLRSRTANPEWDIVEIIPATPVQPKETDLEVRVRVLEKENAMLVRLLMKEGKL